MHEAAGGMAENTIWSDEGWGSQQELQTFTPVCTTQWLDSISQCNTRAQEVLSKYIVSKDDEHIVSIGLYHPTDLFPTVSLIYVGGLRDVPLFGPCVGE